MGVWASRARDDTMQLTKNGPVDVASSDGSIDDDDEKSDMADQSEPSSSADLHDSGITETDDEPWGITVTPPDTVTLHWGPPARGVIRALSYIVEKRDPSDQDWVPVVIVDANVTSYVIRELDLHIEHWFRVLARSSMGLTTVLDTDRPVQLRDDEWEAAEPPDPPSTPLLVVVTGPFSMDVKWTAPSYDGGRPVLGYVVAVREPRRTLWMEVSQVSAPTVKAQIQDLEEGHEYLVRIYAWNEVGLSEPLETPEGTKIIRPPGVVVPPSPPLGPLVIDEITESSVRLSWKPPLNDGGDVITNYIVEYRDVSAAEIAKFSVRTPDARTRFTVEALKSRHFYVFRISGENQAGVGDALVDKKPVRVQAAPKKPPAPDPPVVTVHPTMPDACVVTWSPPCDGVTLYVLERCDLVGDVWIVVSQQREAEFVAQNLVPGIEYSFRVSAENEVGMGKWSKPSEPIVITRKVASMTAPEFTKELSDVQVLVDNDASFTCQFTGKPTPEITWYKGGQEIFESPRADIDTSLASSTLLLKQVRLEDKGKIQCQALNNAGLKTTTAKLTVLAPPKLISSPAYKDGLIFDSGETVRVKLSYTGQPPPVFVWKRNGEVLAFDEPNCSVVVDSDDQTILFKIVDADSRHRGTYTLEASNEHGRDEFSVDIMVTGEPDPPQLPPEITSVDWTSCTLVWKPTENDGGSPVSSYIVEKRLMDNELWLKATTTHHENCTVYGLEEGAKYAFRLRAVTVYGTSKPGPSTEPVSLPRLDSRADTLATEIESTEGTEAIATEQELGSTEEDVTLTVTKYDSDDQRSSLDVDEFLNEDAALSEAVSQITVPLVASELSDYETFVPSSTVKAESGEVSEIDNDTLAKRASLEVSDVVTPKEAIHEAAVLETKEPEETMAEMPTLPERKEMAALPVLEHSYEIIPYSRDEIFDLSLEDQRYEQATQGYIPLTVSCTVTVLTWQNADDVSDIKRRPDIEQSSGIHLVPHTFCLVVFSPPLLLDQVQDVTAPQPPEGITVRVVTLAQWNMYRNLLPGSSFLIIDVSEPLLVLAPPLALESAGAFVDHEKGFPVVCRFTLCERLPLPVNYIIDTLLSESNLRRREHPSRACCCVEYIETVPSPMAIITTVRPNEPLPSVITMPQLSPELLLEHPTFEKRRELLSASPADSGVDTSFGQPRPYVRSEHPGAEFDEEFYLHDAFYYKKAARVKEFDVRTRRSYSRRITSLSRTIERDYSSKKSNIDRLATRISSEMSSLERDLEMLRSMQSMLRRELTTRERPSGDQNGVKQTTNGRKSEGASDSASSRVRPYPESGSRGYLSRRLSRSDSSESEEPQPARPRAKPKPKGEAPRFVTRLDNRIAPSGYRIKLHCTVMGDPMPQVTWLKNGIKIVPDNRHIEITLTEFGMCSLEIYNVKPEDTAEYTCHAVNAYGDATTSAYLRVTGEREVTPEEPKFESCAPDLTVRPGGKAVFSWRATGSPTPTLKVMKDSKPLRTNLTTDVIISKDGVCRVCIPKVSPSDAGVFTCTAENDSGTAVSTSILTIAGQEESSDGFQEERRRLEEMHIDEQRQEAAAVERASMAHRPRYDLAPEEDREEYYKPRRHFKTYGMLGLNYLEDVPRTTHEPFSVPGPPLDPVVTETGPTSATLVWTKPIYNGGSPITGYRIQCREVPSKQWRDKATSRICLCDIFGLKPQTEYVFQVSAGNKNGWGQPTIAVPELKNWRWRQQ